MRRSVRVRVPQAGFTNRAGVKGPPQNDCQPARRSPPLRNLYVPQRLAPICSVCIATAIQDPCLLRSPSKSRRKAGRRRSARCESDLPPRAHEPPSSVRGGSVPGRVVSVHDTTHKSRRQVERAGLSRACGCSGRRAGMMRVGSGETAALTSPCSRAPRGTRMTTGGRQVRPCARRSARTSPSPYLSGNAETEQSVSSTSRDGMGGSAAAEALSPRTRRRR